MRTVFCKQTDFRTAFYKRLIHRSGPPSPTGEGFKLVCFSTVNSRISAQFFILGFLFFPCRKVNKIFIKTGLLFCMNNAIIRKRACKRENPFEIECESAKKGEI